MEEQPSLTALHRAGPGRVRRCRVRTSGRHDVLRRIVELREAARREKNLLALFIEHAPAEIAMFDRRMRYLAASRRWRRDYGLPATDVTGLSHYEVFPEIGEVWKEVHRRALGGEVVTAEEDRFERADGSVQWVTWEVRPWYLASGRVGGIVIAAEEITERVLARQRLEVARHEADAANRAKDEFLAMLGHELRNPLAPITTALQLMRRRGGPFEREREAIERQVTHLTRLIDDLLDVSRIAQGKVRLARERVEIGDVATRAVELVRPLLDAAHHELCFDVPPEGLAVDADPTRMTQVVSNLLTNAAKYTPRGGHLGVSARREGDRVVVRVSDDGPGISPDLLPRVFDLFIQGSQGMERAQGGLGLGLAIVRSLVELHGGRVEAESEVGKGTAFTVSLPPAAPAAEERAAVAAVAEVPRPPPLRVLVVDDNRDAADLLGLAVEAFGHEARVSYDPLDALTEAASFRPDVALVDVGLPVMDGHELARRLRTGPHPPGMLVAITGYGQESDRRRSAEAGFDVHLVKPVAMDEVDRLLAAATPVEWRRRAEARA